MQPITKVSITDKVVEAIKEYIITGNYSSGDKLPSENGLSQQLQVGRSTIREALRILQAMGYVDIQHGRGAFVAQPRDITASIAKNWFSVNNYKIADIMEVRLAVEQMMAKLCATNMTDNELASLMEIHENFAQAIHTGQINQIIMFDEYFHAGIAKGSHNPLFITINSQISDALRSYRAHSYSIPENRTHAVKPHQDIIQALVRHDPAEASEAMEAHILIALEDMSLLVQGQDDAQTAPEAFNK